MTLEEMKTKIFELVGTASMCWDEIPHGVFDSTQAMKVAEQIFSICKEAVDEAKIEGLGMFLRELNPYQMVGELNGARAQRDADLIMKTQIAIKELKEKL